MAIKGKKKLVNAMSRDKRPKTAAVDGGKSQDWWDCAEGEAHDELYQLVSHIETYYEKRRRVDNLWYMGLYGDKRAKYKIAGTWEGQHLKFNLCKAVSDAAQASIAGMRPKPKFLTQRGDWGMKRRAQASELMVEAEYEANNVYEMAARGFLDACKTGTTGFKIYNDGSRPKIELLQPGALLVDPMEAKYGNPKGIYEVALVSRYEALGRWGDTPERRAAIEAAPIEDGRTWFPWLPIDTKIEQILVMEAHRESDPGAWNNTEKGRHVVIVRGATLLDEEWDRPNPYCLFRYDTESAEFWGRGLVENLAGLQVTLNRTLRKVEECIELAAGPRVWVEEGSNVNPEHFDDIPGAIMHYSGVAPTIEVTNTVPQQLLEHVETTIRRGFEQEGLSMLGAMGRKPAGLNSGAALREHNDIENSRFIVKSQAYERWLGVTLAERLVEEKRWIADNCDGDPRPIKAKVTRGRNVTLKTLDWSDARLDPSDYEIQVFPASSLPTTPAGRIATVEAWIGSGLLSREQGMQLLDFPDLQDFTSKELALQELVLYHIEVMLEDGEFFPPSALQDPGPSIELAKASVLRAETDGAPEDHTDLVYQYIDDLRAYQEQAMAAAQPQPAAGAPVPGDINTATANQMSIAQA